MRTSGGRYPSGLTDGTIAVRRWERGDVKFLAEASSQETDPWSPLPLGRDEPEWARALAEADDSGEFTFIIERLPGPRRAGLIRLGPADPQHRVAEISGYWVAPEMRGESIATTAIRLVTNWAMSSLGLSRLHIFTRPDNVASRRAARRAGFAEEGILRSLVEVAGERSDAVVLSRVADTDAAGAAGAGVARARPHRRLISADSHLDLPFLPADLWQRSLPSYLREAGPRVVETERGARWYWEGETHAPSATGSSNARFLQDFFRDFDVDCPPGSLPPSDPELVVSHLDRAGVTAQVTFPPVDTMIIRDVELMCASVRAYNEFALQLGEASGGRIVPLATLPAAVPEKCAAEARWAVEHGFRGLELNPMHVGEPLWADVWDKLYDTVEEAGVPLGMHIADARGEKPVKHHGQWGAHVVRASFAVTEAVTALLFSGALERRPGFRLLLGECRVGWIPFLIQQAQQAALERDTDLPLSLTPAEVWQRQIAATFEEDRIGARLLASSWSRLAGTVMWATDYPHNHNVCFDPHPVLDELFADVPDDVADHACYGKAAEWFGI